MHGRAFALLTVAIALCLGGCDYRSWFESLAPKEEITHAKDIFAELRAHDFDAVESKIDPALRNASLRQTLETMAGLFPEQQPSDIDVVGYNVVTQAGQNLTTYNLSFQYEYPSQWILADAVLERRGDSLVVRGIHARSLPDSLQHLNRFTFADKSALQYAALAWAIFVPVFIVVSTIVCIRTPIPRRKWLWIIFILVGFGQFELNWTTGDARLKLGIQLLGAAVTWLGPYAPMILSGSLPVGAAVFWIRRKKWLRVTPVEPAQPPA